jgi:glycosyltransferase involved in cell wall biosynthesis
MEHETGHSAMNLLFFQCVDQAGGGSRASLGETLRALRHERPDWQLTLVTRDHGPLSRLAADCGAGHQLASFPRFRKPWERLGYWWACRRLAQACAGLKPDGIVSNEWVTAPHALAVARRLRIPAMSYVRDFAALERGRKYQLHRMDRLLCVGESMRRALIGCGYDPAKVRTVYNPVLRPAPGAPESAAHARILQAGPMDHWLLYLGRISARKNQLAAVATLRRLRDASGRRWGLILAGDADDAYAAEVRHAADHCGLADAVIHLGLVANPSWLFDLADASVLTSKSEGLARVLVESLLCGTPAFSYPLDGLGDVYGDAAATYVAPHRQPEDLAATILAALSDSDALRQRTAALGLTLEARHSVQNHVAAFADALRA